MFNRSKAWAIGLLGATFLAGLLMGGGLERFLRAGDREDDGRRNRRGYVEFLKDELSLNPSQETSVRSIVEASRDGIRMLSERIRPEYDSIRTAVRAEIAALLDPEQQQQFEAMIKRSEERRRQRSHER